MSTSDVNGDSDSSNAVTDEINDADIFDIMTGQELRFQDSDKYSHEDMTDASWLEMLQFQNSDASNTSNGFSIAADLIHRDQNVKSKAAQQYEVSVQPDHDNPIPGGSCIEVNADEEEPLNPGSMPLIFNKAIKQEPDDIDYDADTIPVDGIKVEREIPEDVQVAENRQGSNLLFNEDAMDAYDLPAKNFAE